MMGDRFEIITYAGAPGGGMVQRDASLAEVVQRMKLMRGGPDGGHVPRSYSSVSAVYACVSEKAKSIGGMPMMISTLDDQIVESGPLVDLVERPNPRMSGRQFWRTVSAHLDLFGRCHWWMELAPGGVPVSVVPVNPLQMTPIVERGTGELVAWRYRAAGAMRGHEESIPVDEVHTIVDPDFEDPDRPHEGLSPRRAAMLAIAQYYKADLANERALTNDMAPTGVFQTDSNPTEEQLRFVREQLKEQYSGPSNRRRVLVLEGGLKYEPMGSTFSDMEFGELKKMSRTDVCAAFGVPPSVCGFYDDSNYAHAEAAEAAFWIRTVLPRAAWLAEEWRVGVLSRFRGDRSLALADASRRSMDVRERSCFGLRGARKAAQRGGQQFYPWFDSSDVPAMQAVKLKLAEAGVKWNAMGVPLNDLIRAFDLPFAEQPHGNTWWKPFGLVDVADDTPLPGFDDPAGPEAPDGDGSDERASTGRRRASGADATKAPDEARRARIWLAWRASWAALERAGAKRLKRHFYDLRKIVLDKLDGTVPDAPPARAPATGGKGIAPDDRRDLVGSILFDLVEANGKLQVSVGPLIREAYRLGGAQSMQEDADAKGRDKPDPFNLSDPRVAEIMRRRQIKLNDANRRVQRKLAESLAAGLAAGENKQQLADRVRAIFTEASGPRARRIAMTEIGSAVEESRHEGRRQAGVPLKSWLHSRKETGRPTHAATERATIDNPIPQDQQFEITGTDARCLYPRGTGRPEHDINCGCTAVSRYPNDTLAAVLDRYGRRGFLTYEQLTARDGQGIDAHNGRGE